MKCNNVTDIVLCDETLYVGISSCVVRTVDVQSRACFLHLVLDVAYCFKEDVQARDSSGPEDGSSAVRANIIVFLQSEDTDKEEGAS